MSPRLRDHPDDLNALCSEAGTRLGVNSAFLEKDLWAIEVLRAAVAPDLNEREPPGTRFIFKGGTSLSRGFNLISRFSEDIDLLAVLPSELSIKARHRVLKRVHERVAEHTGILASNPQSTTGIKRDASYRYPAIHQSGSLRQEGVLLELGTRGGIFPTETKCLRSMLADFAVDTLGETQLTWEEWTPFKVELLAPERALLEKFAVVHAAVEGGDPLKIRQSGRHYYDIARLLNTATVVERLAAMTSTGRLDVIEHINIRSQHAGWMWRQRPEDGYASSLAFDTSSTVWPDIAAGYEQSADLIYGEVPELESIVAAVLAHRTLL